MDERLIYLLAGLMSLLFTGMIAYMIWTVWHDEPKG